MANVSSVSDKMMYSTLRLTDKNRNSNATGFIFTFKINNLLFPILVTNRHFAEGVSSIDKLDFSKKEFRQQLVTKLHLENDETVEIDINVNWHLHSKEDLCFLPLMEIYNYVQTKTGKKLFYITLSEDNIPTKEQLDSLSAIEDVVMVGYPNGLYDEAHNLPIFRKGITSSHPGIDYNGKRHALVDMACLPGSSGSPIFLLNEGMYHDKKGNTIIGNRLYFLGIENAMPQRMSLSVFKKSISNIFPYRVSYDLTDEYAVADDLNLGYYIKSSELNEFKELIIKANPNLSVEKE